jgi:hypothetical protein
VSEAALRQLHDAQAALIAALDGRDVDAIHAANRDLAKAGDAVAAAGGWRDRPALRQELVRMLRMAEAARGRVNALADLNSRKLDKLTSLAGHPPARAYARSGQLR